MRIQESRALRLGRRILISQISRQRMGALTRMAGLLALAVVGTALVLLVVVAFTPIDMELIGEREPDTQSADSASPMNVSAAELPALPETAAEFEPGQLQSELRKLTEMMQNRYPQDPAAYHFSAQIYAELKQNADAEKLWLKCISMGPSQLGPFVGLANLMSESGRDEEAIELLSKLGDRLGTSAELLLQQGNAHENLGLLDEAQGFFENCTQRYPQIGLAWLSLGRVLNQKRKYEAAESSLNRALELGGHNEQTMVALATALVRQGRNSEAAKLHDQLRNVRSEGQTAEPRFQDQYDSALRGIAAKMMLAAASLEEEHGQFAEAIQYSLRAIEIEPNMLQAYMSLSSVYRKQNRWQNAMMVQQRLLELQPDNLLNYLNLANVAIQAENAETAEATLLQAISRDPNGTVAQHALARLYLVTGRIQEASDLAVALVARNPRSESYRLLAETYKAMGKPQSAQAAEEKSRLLEQALARPEGLVK